MLELGLLFSASLMGLQVLHQSIEDVAHGPLDLCFDFFLLQHPAGRPFAYPPTVIHVLQIWDGWVETNRKGTSTHTASIT